MEYISRSGYEGKGRFLTRNGPLEEEGRGKHPGGPSLKTNSALLGPTENPFPLPLSLILQSISTLRRRRRKRTLKSWTGGKRKKKKKKALR